MRDNERGGVVRLPVEKQGTCPVCQRYTTRTRTFTAPVRVNGVVRSADVIMDELRAMRDAWIMWPTTHAKCDALLAKTSGAGS